MRIRQSPHSIQNTNLQLLIKSMLMSLDCLEKVAKKHIEKPFIINTLIIGPSLASDGVLCLLAERYLPIRLT